MQMRVAIVFVFIIGYLDTVSTIQSWNRHQFQSGVSMLNFLKNEKGSKNDNSEPSYSENCSVCGITHDSAEGDKSTFVINEGDIVEPHYKYPWAASLFDMKYRMQLCSASILSKNYAITAAHCLETIEVIKRDGNICKDANDRKIACFRKPSEFRIQLLTESKTTSRDYKIGKIIPHPKYDGHLNAMFDISLLKFEKPIKCNKFNSPVCLPPSDFLIDAKMEYTLTGRGTKSEGAPQSDELRVATFKSASPSKCMSKIREHDTNDTTKFTEEDYVKFYCMVGVGNQTACKGDSGAALFGPIFKDRKMYAVGIMSGNVCEFCDPDEPIFLVALSGHLKWIRKVTGLKPAKGSQSFIAVMKEDICGPNEKYSACVIPCNDCRNRGNCSRQTCRVGCDCLPGYRRFIGKCIPETNCPPGPKLKGEFGNKRRRYRRWNEYLKHTRGG